MSEWAGSGSVAVVHSGTAKHPSRDSDPFAPVLALGDRAVRGGAVIGILFALLTHGAGAARAILSLSEMAAAVSVMRASLHDYFWTMYDVDLPPPEKPPTPEKPPEPEPEPEPEPVAIPEPKAPQAPKEEDPYDPPPAPAQAAKVLTAPEDPSQEKIEDLTDQGFVSGEGTGPGYGMVSAAGTSSAATWNKNAQVGGVPGGKGTGAPQAPPPPPPGPDLSRPANIIGGTNWNCPFPPEADADQIDSAVVTVSVTVRPDGSPLSVKVVSDPGHGFGRAARMCALGRKYQPALDRAGQPITATMPPIRVSFVR